MIIITILINDKVNVFDTTMKDYAPHSKSKCKTFFFNNFP